MLPMNNNHQNLTGAGEKKEHTDPINGLGSSNDLGRNFTQFGQTTPKPSSTIMTANGRIHDASNDTATPTKRPSIDESWVNVDWTEVSRHSQHNSPPKSPSKEFVI